MTLRQKRIIPFALSAVLYLTGQYLRGEWFPRFTWPFPCNEIQFGTLFYCDPLYLSGGWALIEVAKWIALAGVIMLFARPRAWRPWFWFSAIFVPVAGLVIFTYFPQPWVPGPPIGQDTAAIYCGVIYTLVTLGIVIIDRFRK